MPSKPKRTKSDSLDLSIEKRRLARMFIVMCFALVLLNTVVLKPIYIFCTANILVSEGAWPYILDVLIHLCSILTYTLTGTVLIYFVFFFKSCKSCFLSFVLISLVGKIGDLISTLLFNGSLALSNFLEAGTTLLLEVLLIAVFYTVAHFDAKKYNQQKAHLKKAKAMRLDTDELAEKCTIYPFSAIYRKSNPLQKNALVLALVLAVPRILGRLLSDVFFGLPSSWVECLVMIAYYLSDLLVIPISYLASMLLFSYFFKQKEQIHMQENNSVK